jgi:glutamate N-acetyltransferase / amino-acid N-acetyltransferase
VVTTTNLVKAPACELTERHAADGTARAVLINSGNANVCTPHGAATPARWPQPRRTTSTSPVEDVLVMSTGVIGVPLPLDRITGLAAGTGRGADAHGR